MFQVSESVKITYFKDRFSKCDSCDSRGQVNGLYEIAFTSGPYTSLVELCEEHLNELREVLK